MANRNQKVKANRPTKREIYASFEINYKAGKIESPIGWINPLLINGNSKLGQGVWTFSTLAANVDYTAEINGEKVVVRGTCPCKCPGCYACNGCYKFHSTINSLARKTVLVRKHLDFVRRAILAQIIADKIAILRIHASGDFAIGSESENESYLNMWCDVIAANPAVVFWTYTKVTAFESAFDRFNNANIVKSLIDCGSIKGLNYGKAGYLIALYKALKAAGKNVYICRCGVDKEQHCTNCHGCAINDYVLFLEHGTVYKPEEDPDYPAFIALVESQPRRIATTAATTAAAAD